MRWLLLQKRFPTWNRLLRNLTVLSKTLLKWLIRCRNYLLSSSLKKSINLRMRFRQFKMKEEHSTKAAKISKKSLKKFSKLRSFWIQLKTILILKKSTPGLKTLIQSKIRSRWIRKKLRVLFKSIIPNQIFQKNSLKKLLSMLIFGLKNQLLLESKLLHNKVLPSFS
jgi:hypothetical protein